MLSFQLTETGYQILRDGVVWIDQYYDPSVPRYRPYASQEAAAAAAQAEIDARKDFD